VQLHGASLFMGHKKLDIFQILCVANIMCVRFVSMVHILQVTKFCTVSPDIFSITIEFFLTNSTIYHFTYTKQQALDNRFRVSPELHVLSIESVSYHLSSA
jgi:hypothetical protein